MQTGRMQLQWIAENIFRCPRCKSQLEWENNYQRCTGCRASYPIRDGVLPVYDLYIDDSSSEIGRDPQKTWDLEEFEQNYERTGYHEAGSGFDKQLGYPEEFSRFLFQRVKGRLLEWIQPAADHAVLDIGCGAGYFLFLILQRYRQAGFTPALTGLDVSLYQLSYMVRRMEKEGVENVVAIHGNGEYLPFADNSFDLVTCSEVIEHIRNPIRALSEMRRILKPSGRLLLSTPSMTAEKQWARLLSPFAWLVKRISHHRPDPNAIKSAYEIPWYAREFRNAIGAAGLEIESFEYNAVIPHPWHFKFLPRPLVRPVIAGFWFVDTYLKFLFKPLALHFVVRASKPNGG